MEKMIKDETPLPEDKCEKTNSQSQGTIFLPFMCEICNVRFCNRTALQEHAVGHVKQMYKCPRCSRMFRSRTEWLSHLAHHPKSPIVDEYLCKNCSKRCFNFTLLKTHVKRCVNSESQVCLICLEIFNDFEKLNDHLKIHEDDGTACLVPQINSRYHCANCHWDFWSRGEVTGHDILKKTGIIFKCSICLARFCLRAHLDEHMMWHKKTEPFKCKYCPTNFFSSKTELQDHLDTHDPLRPYKCQFCKKCFLLPSSRQLHVQESHLDVINQKNRNCKNQYSSLKRNSIGDLSGNGNCQQSDLLQLVQETIQIAESSQNSDLKLTKSKREIDVNIDSDIKKRNVDSDLLDGECNQIKQPRMTYSRKLKSKPKSILLDQSSLCGKPIDYHALETNFQRILVKLFGEDVGEQFGIDGNRNWRDMVTDFLVCAGLRVSIDFNENLSRFISFVLPHGYRDDNLLREKKIDELLSEMAFSLA